MFTVKPGSFNPPPKVMSAVIRLRRKENQDLGCDEVRFKKIVKAGFGQRRKMLRNTLKDFFTDEQMQADPIFMRRPEQLGLSEFVYLTNLGRV
jgi:16S rRNA (adenine1518-N6/adenine1519-N6)-dimethyltransferase